MNSRARLLISRLEVGHLQTRSRRAPTAHGGAPAQAHPPATCVRARTNAPRRLRHGLETAAVGGVGYEAYEHHEKKEREEEEQREGREFERLQAEERREQPPMVGAVERP